MLVAIFQKTLDHLGRHMNTKADAFRSYMIRNASSLIAHKSHVVFRYDFSGKAASPHQCLPVKFSKKPKGVVCKKRTTKGE